MDEFLVSDRRPLSHDSHVVEIRTGFTTCASLIIGHDPSREEWHVESVSTKTEWQGHGLARRLVSYLEDTYGSFSIVSENHPFWEKMGYECHEDGRWRKRP